jgi:transcriptional regulator with XRE-family HTH domain
MELHELRQKLKPFNLKEVAKATGLKYQTVYWIASGRSTNPSYESVSTLVKFLKEIGC